MAEYTATVNIESMAPWHKERYFDNKDEYSITFEAEEGLEESKLIKLAEDKLNENEIIVDYELLFNEINEKTISFSTGYSYEALNTYGHPDAEGGLRRRRSTKRSKKLNKRKRKTIRGRK